MRNETCMPDRETAIVAAEFMDMLRMHASARSETERSVIHLAREHAQTWQDRRQWYWARGLLEEVGELLLALLGLHRHSPIYELMEISSICLNWIVYRHVRLMEKVEP